MTEKTLPPLTAEDMQTPWDNGKTYPFVESEDAVIMGYGHPDRAEFAAQVTDYDRSNDPKWAEVTDPADIEQVWALHMPMPSGEEEDGWWIKWSDVDANTPGAFPVSVIRR